MVQSLLKNQLVKADEVLGEKTCSAECEWSVEEWNVGSAHSVWWPHWSLENEHLCGAGRADANLSWFWCFPLPSSLHSVTRLPMDEQDNDFKELWANILSGAKKKAGDAEGTKRVQNRPKSTTTRSKLRRGKAAAKTQTHHHLPAVKETHLPRDLGQKEQTLVHEEDGDAAACSGETALGDAARSPLSASQLSTGSTECSQRPLTGEWTEIVRTEDKPGLKGLCSSVKVLRNPSVGDTPALLEAGLPLTGV